MLDLLKNALISLQKKFPAIDELKSLHIEYTPPVVFRLWTQCYDKITNTDYRLFFHRIFKITEGTAYYHPHPWESAMYICNGSYKMNLGDKDNIFSTLILPEKSQYEMIHPLGWHSVDVIGEYCDTIMITRNLYKDVSMPVQPPKMNELDPDTKTILYNTFKTYINQIII